jgi:hypothetical protein
MVAPGRAVRTPNDKETRMKQDEDEETTGASNVDSRRRVLQDATPPQRDRQRAMDHASDGEVLQRFE